MQTVDHLILDKRVSERVLKGGTLCLIQEGDEVIFSFHGTIYKALHAEWKEIEAELKEKGLQGIVWKL